MPTYLGTIRDAVSERPIAFATVLLKAGGAQVGAGVASANGVFNVSTAYPADTIVISSVGYKPRSWPARHENRVYELERNYVELPPVVVQPPPRPKKTGFALPLALAALALLSRKKKRVSGQGSASEFISKNASVIVIGGLAVMVLPTAIRIFRGVYNTVDDILSLPRNTWKAVKTGIRHSPMIADEVYKALYEYVLTNPYKREKLDAFNKAAEPLQPHERAFLLAKWKANKGVAGGAAAAAQLAMINEKKAKSFVVKIAQMGIAMPLQLIRWAMGG